MNGQTVFVGITEDSYPLAKDCQTNDVITVIFSGINDKNKLIQPKFYRKRLDVTWNQLKQQHESDNKSEKL